MSTHQDLFNDAYAAVIAQLDGSARTDVEALEAHIESLYRACNPRAYDPSNPPAQMTPAQYVCLFNYGFSAVTDAEGETIYFDEHYEWEQLKARFAYLVAHPESTAADRNQSANQAVLVEMLKLLVRSNGSASDELALHVLNVIEDALSSRNHEPAVLSDVSRGTLDGILKAFCAEGADAVVLDRLEALLTTRSHTRLIVDNDGVARPDKGKWS